MTPLHFASEKGKIEAVKYLVRTNATINACNTLLNQFTLIGPLFIMPQGMETTRLLPFS